LSACQVPLGRVRDRGDSPRLVRINADTHPVAHRGGHLADERLVALLVFVYSELDRAEALIESSLGIVDPRFG
jgi:hypothetical protein